MKMYLATYQAEFQLDAQCILYILKRMRSENNLECAASIWVDNWKEAYKVRGILQIPADLNRFVQNGYSPHLEEVKPQTVNIYVTFLINLLENLSNWNIVNAMYVSAEALLTQYVKFRDCLVGIAANQNRKVLWDQTHRGIYHVPRCAPGYQQQGGSSRPVGDSTGSRGVTPRSSTPIDIDWKWSTTPRCYNCDKLGHIARDCWAPRRTTWTNEVGTPQKKTRVQVILNDIKNGKEVAIDDLVKAMKEEGF
jgi:hypothetical protein